MRRALPTLLLLLAGTAWPAAAQSRAPLEVQLVAPGGTVSVGWDGPRVLLAGVLDDPQTRELLRSGFPAQLRFRLELWRKGGWFDDLERAASWEVIVAYDPGAQSYRVRRRYGSQVEDVGSFGSVAAAQATLERPYRVPVMPARGGRRYYYNAVLDLETLSVSDLDQLERWLRGELRPAVRGKSNPATAVGNGVRTLVTRVLGGEKQHYETRSPTFRAP